MLLRGAKELGPAPLSAHQVSMSPFFKLVALSLLPGASSSSKQTFFNSHPNVDNISIARP